MGSSRRKSKKRRCNPASHHQDATAKSQATLDGVQGEHAAVRQPRSDKDGDRAVRASSKRVCLPVEVWLMILVHFPAISVQEIIAIHTRRAFLPTFRERTNVLRSLSQTSRQLRAIFLPLLWIHVEIATAPDPEPPRTWRHAVAYALRSQCLGLVKTKQLAIHVKTMTVSLAQWSAHPVLKVFGRCLEALPNLHSLHVISCSFSKEDIRTEFTKRKYPSIRKMLLPALACPILHACPKVQTIEIINSDDCYDCMKAILKACPKVENVQGIMAGDPKTCQAFSKTLTRLDSLRLIWPSPQYWTEPICVSFLSACSSLRTVALCTILSPFKGFTVDAPRCLLQLERSLALIKTALENVEGPAKKKACATCRDAQGRQIALTEEVS